ncbi:MAG: zinc ABC transporter solute-binding protein [Sulfurovum sp.]|nr:zinc ABC transporter solute-binding protein [Sulfurovum sp.]
MKKIILLFLLLNTYIFSNINAIVSIVPVQTFVKAIGGEYVNTTLMVQAGDSPHSYEPKPSQMLSVAKADLYFAIGVEFENVWLPKFTSLNPKMTVTHLNENVSSIDMASSHHEGHDHGAHNGHEEHSGKDPHIWTAPKNVAIIAQNIFDALSKRDPKNLPYYKKNLETFLNKVAKTDAQIKEIFSTYKGSRTFMVFHPSWGYFAKAYGLEQVAVEVEGKSPKPRELVHLLQEAKEEKVSAIFTQPEFSDASAKIIAKELNIPVIKISPMAKNWSENLIHIAKSIAGKE